MAYSQDNTFFVESDDMSYPRISVKDAAKMIARNKQEMIANELSRLACDEYLEDILKQVRRMEDETIPDANLIDMQREIQWFMRPYLIDFLVEAHSAFSLLPETLFLAVNLLDRYCSKRVVYKQHYQLVGCAALLIAAKYGDKKDRVPQISELNNMCCGLYDAGMFTQMEMHVLNTLEWVVGHPTVDFFLKLVIAEERDDREVEHMAAYVAEIALYHRDFVSTKPSVLARASLALARAILARPEVPTRGDQWDHAENVTLVALSRHLHQPSVTLARKYSSSHLSRASARLADFLAQQAAAARAAAEAARSAAVVTTPPSPPLDLVVPQDKVMSSPAPCSTPHKGHHGAIVGVPDGYLTPPITPDGASFGQVAKDSYVAHHTQSLHPQRYPVTPTSQHPQATQQTAYQPQVQHNYAQHHMAQYPAYFDGV